MIAVEPGAHALQVLQKNIRLNGCDNVEVLPVGAGEGEASGQLHLHGDLSRASFSQFEEEVDGGAGEETVRIARLDDLVPIGRPVSFVKIDIEGYELLALRGAVRILRDRPVVLFECLPAAAVRAGLPRDGVWDLLSGVGLPLRTVDGRWSVDACGDY